MTDIMTAIDTPTELLIDGSWQATPARFDVLDPASESPLASIADASPEEGHKAVQAAARAFPDWAQTAPRIRGEVLRRAFEIMRDRREQIAQLITLENGKSLRDSLAEADYAAEFFRWYAEEAVRATGEVVRAPNGTGNILVFEEPVGVCLFITPWNFPAAMATRKIGPALAAGCSCVLKPAAETPLTALLIGQILEEAGLPPGVVNIVTTTQSGAVVSAMMNAPAVRKLSFTGSTHVGRILLAQAAERVVNCSMELGGDAPLIVLDDADLDLAVEGAMVAKMRNGGQACTAANRFYVQAGIWERFVEAFSARMSALKMGPGLDEGVDIGPLVNRPAQDAMAKIVEVADQRGAELLTGGARPPRAGYFFPPTVLVNPDGQDLVDEEVFGPIAPIMRFHDIEDAITKANAVDYGLVSYVFTGDMKKGLQISQAMESGMVALNKGSVSDPAAPFGGVKQSGLGREGGHEGLKAFLESKYVAADW